MVWARTKLTIWDDLFEPVEKFITNYSGKNPEKFYKKVKELMVDVFKIPKERCQEKRYTHEKKGKSGKFKYSWELTKILDNYTYIRADIDLEGEYEGDEGKATIVFEPVLITEYPQDSVLEQNILYEVLRRVWHKTFYHKKRMKYIEFGRKLSTEFDTKLKTFARELE